MTAAELTEWEAWELAYGPITIHERLDVLQAALGYYIAKSAGAKGVDFEDFDVRWGEALERRLELRARARAREVKEP